MRSSGTSLFHYGSSCRMAPEDDPRRPGVVDDELRVHGVDALRIADASVFPRSCTAHPMASVVMVAEKCAHMMMTPWSAPRAVV
jgi:choline dehydrogenase